MLRGFNCFNFSASKKISYEDNKEDKLLTVTDFGAGLVFSVQLIHDFSVKSGHPEAICFKEQGECLSL